MVPRNKTGHAACCPKLFIQFFCVSRAHETQTGSRTFGRLLCFMFVLCVFYVVRVFVVVSMLLGFLGLGRGVGGGVGGRCMCVWGGGTSNYVIIIYANLVMGWAVPNKCPLLNNKCPLFNNKCPLFNNKCQSAESLCDTCVRLKALYVQHYNNTQTNLIIHYISCISHTLPRIHTR